MGRGVAGVAPRRRLRSREAGRKARVNRAEVFGALTREGAIFGYEGESPIEMLEFVLYDLGSPCYTPALPGQGLQLEASCAQGNHSALSELYRQPGNRIL